MKKALCRVIDERSYYGLIHHSRVEKFEKELSKKFEAPALGTNSGTDALILALKAFGVGYGDEVIVPAFGFISIASSVLWVGAKPVFADVREEDFALDPHEVERKITSKTKAIMVAHLFGQPAESVLELGRIAKNNKIPLIENGAQAMGAEIKINNTWRPVGTLGDIACLSFGPSKTFSALGSGGAMIFNTQAQHFFEAARTMRTLGARVLNYDYPTAGVNNKLQELQAAALLAKWPFVDYWLAYRRIIAEYYTAHLSGIKDLILSGERRGVRRIWYRYIVKTKQRDLLFDYLLQRSRDARFAPQKLYPVLLPHFSIFRNVINQRDNFPVASHLASETLALPLSHDLSYADCRSIVENIKNFYRQAPRSR